MSQAALGVRLEKTPVEALQHPGPLAARTPGGGGHGSLQLAVGIYREVRTAAGVEVRA